MVLHGLVAITKLKLFAAAGHGHCAGQLLAALLVPFVLKLSLSSSTPRTLGELVFSTRLFLFRLRRIFFEGRLLAAVDGGRWGRALRLVSGRTDSGRRLRVLPSDEGSLHAMSMVVL